MIPHPVSLHYRSWCHIVSNPARSTYTSVINRKLTGQLIYLTILGAAKTGNCRATALLSVAPGIGAAIGAAIGATLGATLGASRLQQPHDLALVFRRRRGRSRAQKLYCPADLLHISPAGPAEPEMKPRRRTGPRRQCAVQVRGHKLSQVTAFQHGVTYFLGRSANRLWLIPRKRQVQVLLHRLAARLYAPEEKQHQGTHPSDA